MKHLMLGAATAVVALVCVSSARGQATMIRLGPAGSSLSVASATDAIGEVVVGSARSANGRMIAFRWTEATGIQELGLLPGMSDAGATAVSANGMVVVGSSTTYGGAGRAFRWTALEGMVDLGTLSGGSRAYARAISGDGAVVVGLASVGSAGPYHAFRWTTANGMEDLGTLPGAVHSRAYDVNYDGSRIVGESSIGDPRPFLWTAAGGMLQLPMLKGATAATASVISDGSLVAGWSNGTAVSMNRPVRWTAAGMHSLGITRNLASFWPSGINADGTVIVGLQDNYPSGSDSWIWGERLGIWNMHQFLQKHGVNVSEWTSLRVSDVSADGRTIVGSGERPRDGVIEAWLVRLSTVPCYANCDNSTAAPLLGVGDFACFLQLFAAGDAWANCDNSTTPPRQNVADFTCFLQRFAAGCE